MPDFITGRENWVDLPTMDDVVEEGNQIAAEHFEEERMLNEPSVVFEFGSMALQQAFVTEEYRPKIENALESGRLQLVNFWGVENASQAHSLMYMNLARVGYKAVPGTIACVYGNNKTQFRFGEFTDCPLWVRKKMFDSQTGQMLAHRGRGVSFFYPTQASNVLPRDQHEFTQQFVLPPDGCLRDIRTYIVGNKVIPGYIRQAEKPITEEQLNNRIGINNDQFVTAEHPGQILPLTGDLAERAIVQAKKFQEAMVASFKLNRKFLDGQPVMGFVSVDFLLDKNNELLVSDFDVGPGTREQFGVSRAVAKALADYISALAHKGGEDRSIYIFSDPQHHKFIQQVEAILLQSEDPKKLVFKDSLETAAYYSHQRNKLSGI